MKHPWYLWLCYAACIIVAVLAYGEIARGLDAATLTYGFWSWLGGAFFMALFAHYTAAYAVARRLKRARSESEWSDAMRSGTQ